MGCGASAVRYSIARQGSQDSDLSSNGKCEKVQNMESNQNFEENMRFLMQVPLLSRLPAEYRPQLAAACETVRFDIGSVVIQQGDMGDSFFLISAGSATVHIIQGKKNKKATTRAFSKLASKMSLKISDKHDLLQNCGEQVALLSVGDFFGEQALLSGTERSATIMAASKLTLLKITRENFESLGLAERLKFANRKAVGCGIGRKLETHQPDPKEPHEEKIISKALFNNSNLANIDLLDANRVQQMVDVAWKQVVEQGEQLITEGDVVADYFFVVQEGQFQILQGGMQVAVVGPGGSFGELALLYLVPRAATVQAVENSLVWVIDRGNFKRILMQSTDAQTEFYASLLAKVEVLTPLLTVERNSLAEALVEMHYSRGEVIIKQGEYGNTFYLMYEGEVSVQVDGTTQAVLCAQKDPVMFGEIALLRNEPRTATIVVTSDSAKVLALDRDSFDALLGPLSEIVEDTSRKRGRSQPEPDGKTLPGDASGSNLREIPRSDLRKVGLLGCGGFAAVELVEHKDTKETFALKGMSKGFIVQVGMQQAVMNEKNILNMTNSPFIIRLFATYNAAQVLYFLLEPAMGGDLFTVYAQKNFHGSERCARYYSAGVILAFVHMHERYIIYRDLKPENIILTIEGHLKLCDMGLAKFSIGKTYTTCGTPDYFAPELITAKGHNTAVDWWTSGILLYEIITGSTPFEAAGAMQIYAKVLKGIDNVIFPSHVKGSIEHLIKSLLQQKPSDRLPMRHQGVNSLKNHSWYRAAEFSWQALEQLTMEPPYKPMIKGRTDLSNFNVRPEDRPRHFNYKDDKSGWDANFASCA